MKDNYAKQICIIMVSTLIAIMFLIGFALGFVIIKVDDTIDEMHRCNLLIIYGVDE